MRYLTSATEKAQQDLINIKRGIQSRAFIYELLDKNENKKKDLSNISDALVEYSDFTEVKRSGNIVFIGEDQDIDWINDRVRISVKLSDGIETLTYPLGIYLLSSPTVLTKDATIERQVDVYSKLQILIEDKTTEIYTIPQGTVYTSEVLKLIVSAGIAQVKVTSSTQVMQRGLEYPIGTSKLTIINDLLKQIAFNPLDVDNEGFAVTTPYVSPSIKPVTYDYEEGQLSVLYNDFSEELNLFNVPNTFVVVASNAESLPLKSIYINNSLTDPTSVINRGRRIVKYEQIDDISNQAALDIYAQRLADESNDVYGEFVFETSINPMHESKEILRVVRGGTERIYEEVGWRINLNQKATMRHVGRWLGV